MSQITDHRRGRLIRRGIAIVLVLVVAPAAYLTYTLTRDRRPAVRTAELSTGDISSTMTMTAMIRPGAIQETSIGRQLVKEVLVQPGDQVKAGDPLVTFDLTEFHDNLKKAQDALRKPRMPSIK
jgi:multidrug efflux pump subunit AcrA (membrane-fusion protein)